MRIAFVIPWYAKGIPGGAESACRSIALNLKIKGIEVEILTTCIKEFNSDWSTNYYNEGVEIVEDIPVRRFKVKKRNVQDFDKVNYKLINKMQISSDEETTFIDEMIKAPELYEYIKNNKASYACFMFIPYMFSTSYYGVKAAPEKSILIPCLHEESYAHQSYVKEMFELASGILYLSKPEMVLSEKLYDIKDKRRELVGLGVETQFIPDKDRFIDKYKINAPFLLYAGRKDKGKNVDLLIDYFSRFKKQYRDSNCKLLLIGGGDVQIPPELSSEICDLGFLPLQDKYDAYSAATVLCQPSVNESFSIVIMESWLCGRPVLVNGNCDVTRNFVVTSNGGLYFTNYEEFEMCMTLFFENADMVNKMGEMGFNYVRENFTWDVVTEKYINFIKFNCGGGIMHEGEAN